MRGEGVGNHTGAQQVSKSSPQSLWRLSGNPGFSWFLRTSWCSRRVLVAVWAILFNRKPLDLYVGAYRILWKCVKEKKSTSIWSLQSFKRSVCAIFPSTRNIYLSFKKNPRWFHQVFPENLVFWKSERDLEIQLITLERRWFGMRFHGISLVDPLKVGVECSYLVVL